MQGILLVGHGTRDAAGVEELLTTARRVAQTRPEAAVEPCFLELADPPIAVAAARLAQRGANAIVVMPLLLLAAGHAKRDVPRAVAAALAPFPQITSTQAGHLGCHPAILQQSATRFYEAIRDHTRSRFGEPSRPETALVLVGRGSYDDDANREMHQFARLAPQSASVAEVAVCFFAMAQPSLEETLENIAAIRYPRVVVQPHLLFDGFLLAGIRAAVAVCAAKHPVTQWITADRLGPTAQVSHAIWERIDEAGDSHFQSVARPLVPAATI